MNTLKALITTVIAAAIVVLPAAAISATVHRAAGKPPRISWADAKHRYGWVISAPPQRPRMCSRNWNVLCATSDGGKHWRAILRVGDGEVFRYLRWSKNAGVVSVGAKWHYELWTRDGGRHWWWASAFYLGAYADASGFGAGPRFFVARGANGHRQLRYAYSPQWPYRVAGWFPTRPLTCAGAWGRWSSETVGPKNICGPGPVGGDGMTAEPAGPAARLAVILNPEVDDGLVLSNPLGIDCGTMTPWNAPRHRGAACTAAFGKGSTIVLRPLVSVGAGPPVVDWTGCSRVYVPTPATGPWCEVTLSDDAQITATFRPRPKTVAR